ncbi:MAG: NUDIX hydrolase [Candidatus Shapirobacteria bacterium]|jgi:8-oxo-dGTP pyrophosphatase MutT (NUDIX family)
MKINFTLPADGARHRFCQNCLSELIEEVTIDGSLLYKCGKCGNSYDRLIDIDPKLRWWVDDQTKEYWHESVGIFVRNRTNQILFMERTIYPYGYTVPAGHLETGEQPESAAKRELEEETGIIAHELDYYKEIDIHDDPCRRGADSHRWHVYKIAVDNNIKLETDPEEGRNPQWFFVKEVLLKKLTPPVKYLLENYGDELAK